MGGCTRQPSEVPMLRDTQGKEATVAFLCIFRPTGVAQKQRPEAPQILSHLRSSRFGVGGYPSFEPHFQMLHSSAAFGSKLKGFNYDPNVCSCFGLFAT